MYVWRHIENKLFICQLQYEKQQLQHLCVYCVENYCIAFEMHIQSYIQQQPNQKPYNKKTCNRTQQ